MVILDGSKYCLKIFENFETDTSLEKYRESNNTDSSASISGLVVRDNSLQWSTTITPGTSLNMVGMSVGTGRSMFASDGQTTKKSSVFQRFKNWYSDRKLVSPEKVFKEIIKGQSQLEADLESQLNRIEDLKKSTKSNGQIALHESIVRDERRLVAEAVLSTAGYKMYLTEDQLVSFYRRCEKGLRLDWIKNFSRFIPTEVIQKKNEADKLKIFDNYVVLHYDPTGKFSKLTEEEIRKKKDPILFGVMKCSRRLYFIGDWKDEYCDLSLDDILKKLNSNGDNSGNILL